MSEIRGDGMFGEYTGEVNGFQVGWRFNQLCNARGFQSHARKSLVIMSEFKVDEFGVYWVVLMNQVDRLVAAGFQVVK